MSNGRFPVTNGSGSVFNNNNNNGNGNTRQHLYPGAFRNYPWPRTNTYLDQKPLVPGISRGEPEAPALSLGERVVWLRDSGPEIGTARWIGRLPLVSPDWSVGVEFDRPIGTSDGKFGTKQYFTTRPNHAFFLPVMALMKAEEYNGETNFGRATHREKDATPNFQTPPRNQATWEKSRANEDNHHRVLHQHCCNYHDHACDASPTTTTTPCYHEAAGANGTRCFVTSTPRNATRHKSVTIKETVGNVPGFGEWSDEDDLSKFPFKSWKSSSRQSVVSCPASVGPPTILIAKELTSDSSDDDRNNGKFKTLMACFLPGVGHRDKKKKKKHRKYILASEKNKISFVSGPESSRQPNTLGAVSAGGDLWRNPPRCDVRSITGSCGSFPTNHHHCVSCGQKPQEVVLPPPRKNFSCSGLEKLNSTCHGGGNTRDFLSATPITPMKKKTTAPAPPSTLHHRPVSPKFPDKNVIKPEIKGNNSTTSLNSTTSTRSHRLPVIRSLDDARNEIDISLIATKYTFVGNSARSNSFSGTNSQKPETTLQVKELKQLNNPDTISPHPRRTPKKKAPQPPVEDKPPNSEEQKKDGSPKKRLAPQPPALPKKMLSHDTMTLFGYTPREGLSRTSSGATLEINLDKSIQSEDSVSDLLSMVAEAEKVEEAKRPEVHSEISSLEVNLATSSNFKKTDEDTKSIKILNIEVAGSSTKKEVVTQTEAKPVVAEVKLKKEEAKKDRAKPKTEDNKVSKKESTSKIVVETTKPTMKTSSSQTNLVIDDNSKSSKKSKRKILGGSKKNLKKSEENKDEVTEILTEIEQVVKSKPTVQDFVAAFTKFTEKAEQIASTSTSQPVTKPEPKPVKITPPKPKIVPIPVAVAPILNKEEKKSLKSFPTKWTFNFKSKEAKEAKKAELEAKKAEEKANLTRNESSPCLESRSEVVRTITPQSSMPLSRKTYNDFKEPEIQLDRYYTDENASHNVRNTQNNVGNNNSAPFIQNREALRRLSKENRNRHGSTLSLGRFVNQQSDIASSAYNNRKCLTPNASPIMSRNRATTAICAGKPPLPVKLVHDTMAEQNSKSANLFSQLEVAIASGQHQKAAVLARELALQKVTGSLTRFKNKEKGNEDKQITVSLYVEDKDNHQGPIPLSIHPKMTVAMLKQKVEEELHFAVKTQRWILGKTFVVNDESTLGNLDVCTPGCPIFLYIVAPDKEKGKRDQADAYDNDDQKMAINNKCGIESFEALTEIVNRMTAATRNMLLAEELQKSMAVANNHEALETLQEEVDLQPTVKEKVLETSDSLTSTETSEESEPVNDDVESDVTDDEVIEGEEEGEEEQEEESDDNNEVFEDAKQLNYQELMQLEDQDLIQNAEVFECPICFLEIEIGEGTVLRDCLHNFCKECLAQAVEYSEDAVIKCPFRNNEYSCDSHLLEREIKALVTAEMFEKHLQRSMAAAESKAKNSFHCKSPDCPGWCLYEDNVNVFQCPVCALENCLTCQAIHEGKDCKQYQDEIEYDAAASEDAKKTKEYLDNMVKEGQAMHCPTCRVIVMKKWGCDWLKCSVCQTEICWVTKGPRWGPGGRGDTSAGCKCGVNGVRCHTLCNYCH